MKRIDLKVEAKLHWWYKGTGFETKAEALAWVASHAALKAGATMVEVITISKHLRAVMAELKRVEAANK